MLISLGLIFLCGIISSIICDKLRIPRLIGMIISGVIIGPTLLNLISSDVLNISSELRKIALIIVLARAGFSLDLRDFKSIGRPAILMCFLPAILEIIGVGILAPKLLGIDVIDALLMGSVLAAVSPAVIVPRMIKLMEDGYGVKKSIPQMIMAGASMDDVFVIVLFTAFTNLSQSSSMGFMGVLDVPLSILISIVIGVILGFLLSFIFRKFNVDNPIKIIIILSLGFLLVGVEGVLEDFIKFSGVLSTMILGIVIKKNNNVVSREISLELTKLWRGAEILLFVLVGATVDIKYMGSNILMPLILILSVLIFRFVGIWLCLIKTEFNFKEKIFIVFSYIPKATVQAAIGGIPLSMGLSSGDIILSVSVLSILITAPIGAILMDNFYKKLINKDELYES